MKAIKKPVQIDYLPFTGYVGEVMSWVSNLGDNFYIWFDCEISGEVQKLWVKTLEGTSYQITTNDYIVRGTRGEFYPVKKDIFHETYDLIDG